MDEELSDPRSRRALRAVLGKVLGAEYDVKASVLEERNNVSSTKPSQRSHLVRAAQALGANVVDEKEEELRRTSIVRVRTCAIFTLKSKISCAFL
mgnify:CR=1 FL=1